MNTIGLSNNKQFYSASELGRLGLSYYYVRKFTDEGRLTKLNNKYYENNDYAGDISDYSYLPVCAPDGVVCLLSAARIYNLTNYLPDAIDIAIERSMKISTLPDWPPFHIIYFSDKRYQTGISHIKMVDDNIKIYDIEKTVVDIIYYRNKLGIEETSEVLKNYLARSDRNITTLRRYANELGCGKILSTYLEVLL